MSHGARQVKRRTFLLAGLGGGGALFLGWSLSPPRQRIYGAADPGPIDGAIRVNGWVTIATDETVTIVIPKAEMGQGAHTALAMLLAEELDCDWARVRVEQSPIDSIYNNLTVMSEGLPFHPDADNALVRGVKWMTDKTMREMGVMMTGASSSVRDCWMPMREAGASARAALLAAAAARLQVDVGTCRTARGFVICGEVRLRYGEVAEDAVNHRPTRVTLKNEASFTLIGRSTARLDSADKSTGRAQYGIDVNLPGMLYAAVAMSPTFGGTPDRFDRASAMAMPGVRAVVRLNGSRFGDAPGVAVIADSWWRAKKGVDALKIAWHAGPHAALSSAAIMARLRAAAATTDGLPIRTVGDTDAALANAAQRVTASYEAPYLAHATMEPMNATVRLSDEGTADLWVGTQVPGFARKAVADIAGIPESQVTVHQTLIGGGFGRRLDVDFIAQAAAIAGVYPNVPIQLIWTREEDMRHDLYRPAAVSQLMGGLDADGRVTAFVAHSASQTPIAKLGERVGYLALSMSPDRTTAEGTWDQPYAFATMRSSHANVELPVPVGSWRSVGHSHQGFFVEAFLDELAAAAGDDAVAFRAALLQRHPRALRVLQLAATKSGWGTPLPAARDGQPKARGVALHAAFGTVVAQVAEVSLTRDRAIRVHRMVCVVDCGFPVNPNIIAQQVESSIIDGMSAALYGEVVIERGGARPGNFNEYALLRIKAVPVIETHIVPSMEAPGGMGEPALPPVAPAIANALFALTGTRLRALPLRVAQVSA